MPRAQTLQNRQDTNRRLTPHDLAAARRGSGLLGTLERCSCIHSSPTGPVTDCAHCAVHGAASKRTFSFPAVDDLISIGSSQTSVEYELVFATGCRWETDSIAVTCDYQMDQFFWHWDVGGRMPGEVTLTLEREAGSACTEVRIVYVSRELLWCNGPLLMVLDPEQVEGVDHTLLPCTVCVAPKTGLLIVGDCCAAPGNGVDEPVTTVPLFWTVDVPDNFGGLCGAICDVFKGTHILNHTSGCNWSKSIVVPPGKEGCGVVAGSEVHLMIQIIGWPIVTAACHVILWFLFPTGHPSLIIDQFVRAIADPSDVLSIQNLQRIGGGASNCATTVSQITVTPSTPT